VRIKTPGSGIVQHPSRLVEGERPHAIGLPEFLTAGDGRGVRRMLPQIQTVFPAASKGLVESDQVDGQGASAERKRLFGDEEGALRR
jgi:hypothetical protein